MASLVIYILAILSSYKETGTVFGGNVPPTFEERTLPLACHHTETWNTLNLEHICMDRIYQLCCNEHAQSLHVCESNCKQIFENRS